MGLDMMQNFEEKVEQDLADVSQDKFDKEFKDEALGEEFSVGKKNGQAKENFANKSNLEANKDKPAPPDAEDKLKTTEEDPKGVVEWVKWQTAFIEEKLEEAWPEAKRAYLMAKTGSSNTAEENKQENKEETVEKMNN